MDRSPQARDPWEPEVWVDEGIVDAAQGAVSRGTAARPGGSRRRPAPAEAGADRGTERRQAPGAGPTTRRQAPAPGAGPTARRPRALPPDVAAELTDAVGPVRASRLAARLDEARAAFSRERYAEARRLLAAIVAEAPLASAPHELLGVCLYRLGRWRDAAGELEAFRALTGSVEQHPVLADCYRALRRWGEVEALWDELKEASPSAELVAEGRIVTAGAMADRGDLPGAVVLLERSMRPTPRPRDHHLRTWYALADLYERAGDLPRARTLFERVWRADPALADVAERLSRLG